VIDSAAELERALGSPGRIPEFLSAFVSYLRGRGVTTYPTLDVPIISGPALDVAGTPLSMQIVGGGITSHPPQSFTSYERRGTCK
jgi:hypothetical protein